MIQIKSVGRWDLSIDLLPGDSSAELGHDGAESAKHGPAPVLQLGLAEPLDSEHIGVGG